VADLEPNLITLSSDEFMGRMPFTEGEKLTTSFLESKFKEMGLEPGNGDSYFQEVPMVSIITYPDNPWSLRLYKDPLWGKG
jgi:heme oxygenase